MLETYQYDPDNIQGNADKATQLAMKIRDVIQTSGTVKRYKINVQCYLGEKKNQRVVIVAKGWNEYILPLVFTMTNDKLRPLTVGVNMLKNAGDGTAAWNIMFAGATISIVPILIVYCCFSRFFMGGLTAGAVKG